MTISLITLSIFFFIVGIISLIIPKRRLRKFSWRILMIVSKHFLLPLMIVPYKAIDIIMQATIRFAMFTGIHWKVMDMEDKGEGDKVDKELTEEEKEIFKK